MSITPITKDDPSLPVVPTVGLLRLGSGNTSTVYALDEHTAVKIAGYYGDFYPHYDCLGALQNERRVYQKIGPHPRICRYLYPVQRGIVLERFGEPLRKALQEFRSQNTTPAYRQALEWCIQIAEGVAHLHKRAVVQGDLGCHNILLKGDEIKIYDFGRSCIHDNSNVTCYQCQGPSIDQTYHLRLIHHELVRLGWTMHEIWTTLVIKLHGPYLPDVSALPVGDIIESCWRGAYQSADEVVTALESLRSVSTTPHKTGKSLQSIPISVSNMSKIWSQGNSTINTKETRAASMMP